MRNTIIASVIVFALGLAAIVVFARNYANMDLEPNMTTPVAARPNCPPLPIGEFGMECLGGVVAGKHADVTVVNVWAWWCDPCRDELPLLEQLATHHPYWEVVGVHADPNASNAAAFLSDIGVSLPSYQDNSNAFASAHRLPNVVPVTVVFKSGEKVGVLTQAFDNYDDLSLAIGEFLE